MNGKVKAYFDRKGYGFIRPEGHDKDVFFHISDFLDDFEPLAGDAVTFEIGQRQGRRAAMDIRPV